MNDNQLRVKVYSSGSTEVQDADLDLATALTFTTGYPGGLYLECSFYVPRDITSTWSVQLGQRMKALNGQTTAWEGYITKIEPTLTADGQGVTVKAIGAWGFYLMTRKWRKWWADSRIDDALWFWDTAQSASEKCTIDRNSRMRFTPKAEQWAPNEQAGVIYTSPTGETIKRVTFDYDLQEGVQSWLFWIYNAAAGAAMTTVTTSNPTPGTRIAYDSGTLATPTQTIEYLFKAHPAAPQTPKSDGTYYAEIANVVIYSEVGNINGQEIAKDVRAKVTEFSATDANIGALTLSLVPFISEVDTMADILTRAANYGDASYNRWAAYVGSSELSTDDKPVLVLEQVPALTDYDYAVRVNEDNVTSTLTFAQDLEGVRNWVAVRYRNALGADVYMTPDDDANLKDDDSINGTNGKPKAGQREEWLDVDTTNATAAANYARRVMLARKDPQWQASGELSVTGYIRAKDGSHVPASQIRAGKRVKLENWLNDLSGSGLTFLITGTNYTDDGQACSLSIGQDDSLDVLLARLAAEMKK